MAWPEAQAAHVAGDTLASPALASVPAETTLAELEARLLSNEFIRIHRQHIVNVAFIHELQRRDNRQLRVVFKTPVSADPTGEASRTW